MTDETGARDWAPKRVGGVTATALDTNTTAQSDLVKIIPIVLLVILLILMLLLRAILAPVLLIGSVVVSYAASLGVSALVFTSAGVVLAATFAALAVIPILFLVQLAFIVAFGVLLDTVIVRSLLVPAVSYDIGRAIWWPSKLWKHGAPSPRGATDVEHPTPGRHAQADKEHS